LVPTTIASTLSLLPGGDFQRAGQLEDAVVESRDRHGSYLVGPPDERSVLGGSLKIEPPELPRDDGVVDEVLGLFVAPVLESVEH
jgi:hypothetical protein